MSGLQQQLPELLNRLSQQVTNVLPRTGPWLRQKTNEISLRFKTSQSTGDCTSTQSKHAHFLVYNVIFIFMSCQYLYIGKAGKLICVFFLYKRTTIKM